VLISLDNGISDQKSKKRKKCQNPKPQKSKIKKKNIHFLN